MTTSTRIAARVSIAGQDRLLTPLIIDDGRPSRAQSMCIAVACAGLVCLVAWVCF